VRASNEVDIPPLSHDIWQSLNEEERHKVQTLIAEGSSLFLISTSFDVGNFDRRFQELKDELGNNGEVISTAPRVEIDQPDKIDFRVLYATAASLEAIEAEVAEFDRVLVKRAGPRSPKMQQTLERIVRAGQTVASSSGKDIDFQVHDFDLLLDQYLVDGITDSLVHLVRNAVDHGIEPADERLQQGKTARGTLMIKASVSEDNIVIAVIDDGRGIDPKITPMIFKPGFSTANTVSETSGRGVGLDVVEDEIKRRGGEIRVLSKPGEGTTFEIRLPVSFRQD
jgi:signal transduction histidine kinase